MLQLKKLIAYLCAGTICIGLCACSGDDGEVILIGEESKAEWSDDAQEGTDSGASDDGAVMSVGKNQRETSAFPTESEEKTDTIRVYVCGAVAEPGVIEIPAGSRVEEALEAVGGFAENANRTYVNLAAWVTDGQMLYFPTEEEIAGGWDGFREQGVGSAEYGAVDAGLVNINTADAEKLCTLPGIGENRAADIIAYREANGFFETCEDIMCVPGIKSGLFEKICDKITVE